MTKNETLLTEALAWSDAHRTAVEDDTQEGRAALGEEAAQLAQAYLAEELENALFTFREATDLTDGRARKVAVVLLTAAVAAAPAENGM